MCMDRGNKSQPLKNAYLVSESQNITLAIKPESYSVKKMLTGCREPLSQPCWCSIFYIDDITQYSANIGNIYISLFHLFRNHWTTDVFDQNCQHYHKNGEIWSTFKMVLSGRSSKGETNPLRGIRAAGQPLTGHLVSATIRKRPPAGNQKGRCRLEM